MAARRLIIVLILLLAASVVAASIAPDRTGRLVGVDTTTDTTTEETTTEEPPGVPESAKGAIGAIGSSGNAYADVPHLHFTLKKNDVVVDPTPYLEARGCMP